MNIDFARQSWELRKNAVTSQAFLQTRLPLCITDPNLPDNPIVFANQAFLDLTGYAEPEVIGRNCRFLQGADTTAASIQAIRKIVEDGSTGTVEIVNYRRDGTAFLNALQLGPILDDNGSVIFFLGSQLDVSEERAEEERLRALADQELLHRLKNIASVMVAIIRMTAREASDPRDLGDKLVGRLTTLSEAHFATLARDGISHLKFSDLATSVLSATAPLGPTQFTVAGPEIVLPRNILTPLSLSLHELAIKSIKSGALGCAEGHVELHWETPDEGEDSGLCLVWTETGGPEVAVSEHHRGASLIDVLIQSVDGNIEFDWAPDGLVVVINFPKFTVR